MKLFPLQETSYPSKPEFQESKSSIYAYGDLQFSFNLPEFHINDIEIKSIENHAKSRKLCDPSDYNALVLGNSLYVLHQYSKVFAHDEQVKLVYLDPPYNTHSKEFSYQDSFTRTEWLSMLKSILESCKHLLRDDGAIYVQVDYHEVHYLKLLMDQIFGEENFQREIIWRIGWLSGYKTTANNWIRNHDTILYYSKDRNKLDFKKHMIHKEQFKNTANSSIERYPIEDVWNASEYDDLNSIAIMSLAGESLSNLVDPNLSIKGQKPERLIERIIRAHTDPGDIVLDPFCGSGTAAAVALKTGRNFRTIEASPEHFDIANRRLQKVLNGEQSGISKSCGWSGGRNYTTIETEVVHV